MTQISLIEFLSVETFGHSYVRRVLLAGAVAVNGNTVETDTPVKIGDTVTIGKKQTFTVEI